MATAIVGALLTTPVTSADRFRATWTYTSSALLPSFVFNPVAKAIEIREWLPSAGFIAISNPTAQPGDQAIVFDVRPASQWTGRTVADVRSALDNTPFTFGWGLTLTRLQLVTYSSSVDMQADQDAARDAANADAAARDVETRAANALGALGGTLGKVLLVVAAVAIVAGLAYIASKQSK